MLEQRLTSIWNLFDSLNWKVISTLKMKEYNMTANQFEWKKKTLANLTHKQNVLTTCLEII